MALEAVAVIPALVLFIVGMTQFGKVIYVNATLNKIVYSAARNLATQQGVNFCNPDDPKIAAAITFATQDTTGTPIVEGLTSLQFEPHCSDGNGGTVPCESTSCDTLNISPRADFIRVTIPNGYPMAIRLPMLNPVPITLQPSALVPAGGVQ